VTIAHISAILRVVVAEVTVLGTQSATRTELTVHAIAVVTKVVAILVVIVVSLVFFLGLSRVKVIVQLVIVTVLVFTTAKVTCLLWVEHLLEVLLGLA